MIKIIFANQGAGKTTYITKMAIEESRKIKRGKSRYEHIVSNTPLNIDGVEFIEDIRKVLRYYCFEKTLILVDEASVTYNNRKMNMSDNEIMFYKYIRHYKSDAIMVSQSWDDIDITLRRLCTELNHMKKVLGLSLIRKIVKKVDIDETTHQIIDSYKFKGLLSIKLFARHRYYKYFNTFYRPPQTILYQFEEAEKK